jgi:mannose-6-phosphate isomerase-like protein (cupin superfamily)
VGDGAARRGPHPEHFPGSTCSALRNEGPADARFLNVHAPSKGFGDHLEAMRDAGSDEEREAATNRFDSDDPPQDGGLPAAEVIVRRAGEAEEVDLGVNRIAILAGRDHAGGPLCAVDYRSGPGFPGPPPHLHETITDSFYVMEGELTLRVGDDTVTLEEGGYALAPPGTVHTFSNPSERPVRFIGLAAPGGFEQFFRDVAAALEPGKPPDPEVMARISSRYDIVNAD